MYKLDELSEVTYTHICVYNLDKCQAINKNSLDVYLNMGRIKRKEGGKEKGCPPEVHKKAMLKSAWRERNMVNRLTTHTRYKRGEIKYEIIITIIVQLKSVSHSSLILHFPFQQQSTKIVEILCKLFR